MKIQEIIANITREDILLALESFETEPYDRPIKDDYTLEYKGKSYPGRELIMRASKGELKNADNIKSYTTILAKKKLIDEGFTKFKDENKMFKYYLKKASNQDITKTTVINSEALTKFFGLNLINRDDEGTISINYLPDNLVDNDIVIRKKQDLRIFIDRKRFSEGDILLFSKGESGNLFNLEIIKSLDPSFSSYNDKLNKQNFFLTNDLNITKKRTNMSFPLNQILFGPPGTGKTDSTVEKALEILDLKTDNREENRETFRSLLNKKIFFVTMHPSYSYEDFVQGIKPITSSNGELLFEPKPGIFKIVSELAKTIYEDHGEITDNDISNKDLLTISYFLSKFDTKTDKKASNYFDAKTYREANNKIGERFNINPSSIGNHRDKFDFLASKERVGWQPKNGSTDTLDNTKNWPYNDVYNELKDKSFDEVLELIKLIENKTNSTNIKTEDNINYVLILDEINRANISKVFGELITLLEDDKRLGNENEMSVILPSGEVFEVPNNLYLIGTMNTADKSIALVDIALRRRFQFIPVYPDAAVIEKFCKSKDKAEKKAFMINVNTLLRKEKGVDFQIGHAYFLKDNSLADVINENIIPLLTEYFRNDLDKVKKHMKDIGNGLDDDYFNATGLLKYTK